MNMGSDEKEGRQEMFRKALLMKRAQVAARIRDELGEKVTEDLGSVLDPASDLGDLSTLDLDRDIDYEILSMHTETLKDIDEALNRLDEGSYGICDECGGEIGEKRLEVVPFALYCLECQQENERLRLIGRSGLRIGRRNQSGEDPAERDDYL